MIERTPKFLDKKPSHICKCRKNKKLALNSGIQNYQILTNDDEVCIPRLSSILLAVLGLLGTLVK